MLGVVLISVLGLQGEAVRPARAAAPELVPSHAYVYRYKKGIYDSPDYTAVIVVQPHTAGRLTCYVSEENLPKTAEQLTALLRGNHCSGPIEDISDPKFNLVHKLIHQAQGNRYIFMLSSLYIGPINREGQEYTSAAVSTSTTLFLPDHVDVLNEVETGTGYPVGLNPVIDTNRLTGLKVYDAAILHPRLEQVPIEQ